VATVGFAWPRAPLLPFAAGGTGEFFSLAGGEYGEVIKTASTPCRGKVPIIARRRGPDAPSIA